MGDRDRGGPAEAPAVGRYAVERQVLYYGQPPDERNYWVAWAIWDRRARTFLAALFDSREDAERHATLLPIEEEGSD